ncbi:MAG: AAA family ATPase, partial [Sedimenticolaceae bacterium]
MLTHISIKDLVIVKQLELEFHAGMHAMTGETGAGKSILIDALGLTLGDKADAKLIRQGADKAEVSAIFDISDCNKARQWLEENDLADDGQLVLRRVLVKEGRSRAYINGSPAPQASLQT